MTSYLGRARVWIYCMPLLPAVAARSPPQSALCALEGHHRRVWFPLHLSHAIAVRSRLLLLRLRPVPRRDILWLQRRVWMCALVFFASLAVRGVVARCVLLFGIPLEGVRLSDN